MQLEKLNIVKVVDDKDIKQIEDLKLKGFIESGEEPPVVPKEGENEEPPVVEEEETKKPTKK